MFDDVVGIDYSNSFINKCQELKQNGKALYQMTVEGDLCVQMDGIVDPDIVSNVQSI